MSATKKRKRTSKRKRKQKSACDWAHYNPLHYVTTFSKALTYVWVAVWVEVILFSEIAAMFQIGDSMAIQYINEDVKEIGLIVMGFYFSSKAVENIAEGYENWKLQMNAQVQPTDEEPE